MIRALAIGGIWACVAALVVARGQQATVPASPVEFVRDVQPIFAKLLLRLSRYRKTDERLPAGPPCVGTARRDGRHDWWDGGVEPAVPCG